MATQHESTDSDGRPKTKLPVTIRVPVIDPKDIQFYAARLLPGGSGMVWTMPTTTSFLGQAKNVDIINKQIWGEEVCDDTSKSHMALCNSLLLGPEKGGIASSVDVILKWMAGTTFNNSSFNPAIPADDQLSLQAKPFSVEIEAGQVAEIEDTKGNVQSVHHIAPMSGVAFEMALDTEKKGEGRSLLKILATCLLD